jgi:rod shape determining protein RodA
MAYVKRNGPVNFSLRNTNFRLLILCFLCSLYGCILVLSANLSAGNGWKGIITQAGASVVGFILAILISHIDYEDIAHIWPIISGVAVILVLLTFTPLGLNASGTDDTAWLGIRLGSFSLTFQPAELLKIAFIITFSKHLAAVRDNINDIKNILLLGLHACVPIGLVFLQGDDGTALVFGLIFVSMMFAAGLKWQYFAGAVSAVLIAIPFVWMNMSDDKKGRILAIINPDNYIKTYGWQQYQGIVLMGSGKLFGVGYLEGSNPDLFARNNDLIFTVAAEEFGYIGSLLLLALLALLVVELWRCSTKARDPLGSFMCIGTMAMIGFQSIINIGMNVRLLPIIGITLPFFSAGGTSALTLYLAIGLILSVSYYSNIKSSALHR